MRKAALKPASKSKSTPKPQKAPPKPKAPHTPLSTAKKPGYRPTAPAVDLTSANRDPRRRTKAALSVIPVSSITAAFNYLKPSWREYIKYVEIATKSQDCRFLPEMKRMLEVYLSLGGKERTTILPEQLCDRSGVDPADLVAEVCRQLWKTKNFNADIIAAEYHPKVIEKTAKSAIGSSRTAQADRTNFMKMTGALPTPKPSIFADKVVQTVNIGAGSGPVVPKLLSHEDEMKRLEAADAADVIEGEVVGGP